MNRMTDRAEIERLLNQTGRTLEGLPRKYGFGRLVQIDQAYPKLTSKANHIAHQSDVIELLVAALRDALDHPKNRLITKQEILESIQVIPCVIEEKKFGLTYADILRCSQWDKKYYGMYNAITSVVGIQKYEIDDYGKTWRCWASRPTDEERSAAAWEI